MWTTHMCCAPAVMDPAVVNRCSYLGTRHCSLCKDDKAAFTQTAGSHTFCSVCRQVDASFCSGELFCD